MERFCDELRRERERRQISIETICAVTKVSSRHVRALESGDYGELPGGVFRKGILRSYLSVLEIDEPSWMERFEASLRETGALGALEEGSEWGEFAENVRRNRVATRPATRLRWAGVLAMLLALVLCGWCVWHYLVRPHVAASVPPVPASSAAVATPRTQ